jgi:DNA-binding MarR family transcriptional regulator
MNHSAVMALNAQDHELEASLTLRFAHIAVALRAMLWQECLAANLSPIQGQILIFCLNNPPQYCRIGFLAKEFSMTKPTISDAVKTLERKKLLVKQNDPEDLRSFDLILTEKGLATAQQVANYAKRLSELIANLSPARKNQLDQTLTQLIVQLKEIGILNGQRSCVSCQHSIKKNNNKGYFCAYLQEKMAIHEVRLSCTYFQPEYHQ